MARHREFNEDQALEAAMNLFGRKATKPLQDTSFRRVKKQDQR